MKIYVIFNDCPEQFGERGIVDIFLTKPAAMGEMKRQKKNRPYESQYYELLNYVPYELLKENK